MSVALAMVAGLICWKMSAGGSGNASQGNPPKAVGGVPPLPDGDDAKPPLVPALPRADDALVPSRDAGEADHSEDPSMADTDSNVPHPDSAAVSPADSPVPGPSASSSEVPTGAPPLEVADLDSKAKMLLKTLAADADKELANNAKTLTWGLEGWLRGHPKSEQSVWTDRVAQLKGKVNDHRVPMSLEQTNLVWSEKMAVVCQQCADKQRSIDEIYHGKADRIRSSYVTRMKDASEKLKSGGNSNGAAHAASRVSAAADLSPWLEAMGAPAYESGPLGDFSAGDAIVGHWRSLSAGARAVWFMKDGTCRSPDGKGTWERNREGGAEYKVVWSNGEWIDQLSLDQDGKQLAGTNQQNNKVRLVGEDSVPSGPTQEGADEIAGWWK